MNYEKTKKRNKLILIALLLMISLGYALLNANLRINGTSKIKNSSWDIHWNNVQVTSGSVSIGTGDSAAAIKQNDTTEVNYTVTLNKPGDFYEFTVDAVNAGSIDAMIDVITSTYKIGEGEVTTITSSNLPAYLDYSVSYSDGIALAGNQELKAGTTETYKVKVEYKKDITENDLPSTDQSIAFSFSVSYKQGDSNAVPIVPNPISFSTDSWPTIIRAVKSGNTSHYQLGDTKEIDLGTLGTHTVRISNTSTPSECETAGFSQTACGFVLEFADIITNHRMNLYDNNTTTAMGINSNGGWEHSDMRAFVNSTKYLAGTADERDYKTDGIYNYLPTELKNAIKNTTVVSGHNSNASTNNTTTDKLYLLSTKEVWGKESTDNQIIFDSAETETRQLDYYESLGITTSSFSGVIKQIGGTNSMWWLRSTGSGTDSNFFTATETGDWSNRYPYSPYGVSPAFRIG